MRKTRQDRFESRLYRAFLEGVARPSVSASTAAFCGAQMRRCGAFRNLALAAVASATLAMGSASAQVGTSGRYAPQRSDTQGPAGHDPLAHAAAAFAEPTPQLPPTQPTPAAPPTTPQPVLDEALPLSAAPRARFYPQPSQPSQPAPTAAPLAGEASHGSYEPGSYEPGSYEPGSYEPGGAAIRSGVPQQAASPQVGVQQAAGTPAVKPSELIKMLRRSPDRGQLAGVSLSLTEAIQGAANRREQTHLAHAYWELATATAQYYLASREDAELQQLAHRVGADHGGWQHALASQQTRLNAARRAAEAAQLQLQRLMGQRGPTSPPVAADAPHVGPYETRHDEIFAGRPERVALQLHQLLPITYDSLKWQAASVAEAGQQTDKLMARLGAAEIADQILPAYELLSLRRREFLNTARNYNLQIADYTELAAPGPVETRRLVAMLINTSAGDLVAGGASQVQQTSGFEPNRTLPPPSSSSAASSVANPFADSASAASRQEPRQVRRPILQGLRDREHSILVRPLQRLRNRN